MAKTDQPLSDVQVHDLLVQAGYLFDNIRADTVAGNTTLDAARRALALLSLGLVGAMEEGSDLNRSVMVDP